MGRPSLKTPELIEAICARLETGEPLVWICRDEGMPSVATVGNWERDDEAVSSAIARAREIGGDYIAAEALQLIDNVEEDPASRRIRFDGRLKLLAKWHPKRYGDKLDVAHSGGVSFNAAPADQSIL
jgi:hypothetical protein